MVTPLPLTVLDDRLAVCRAEPDQAVPEWANRAGEFTSITRTSAELSIVCGIEAVPPGTPMEGPWRAFKVQGPLVMTLIGVIESLARPLAEANISIFAISTYDTDYVLVHEPDFAAAVEVLVAAGHTIT